MSRAPVGASRSRVRRDPSGPTAQESRRAKGDESYRPSQYEGPTATRRPSTMSDVTATFVLESRDLALTETVEYDPSAVVRPVTGAGNVANTEGHLFTVRSDDFERFEAGLERDPTIAAYERVVETADGAVYRFEYTPQALLFSPAIASVDGVPLEFSNDGTAWTVRVWLPDRDALVTLWERAVEEGIAFTLKRVRDYVPEGRDDALTDAQHEALLLALEMGYFEEPRGASLREVAEALDISQPAAGGLLRRGIRRLILSTVAPDDRS